MMAAPAHAPRAGLDGAPAASGAMDGGNLPGLTSNAVRPPPGLSVDRRRAVGVGSNHALPGGDAPECGSRSGLRWYCGQTLPGRHFEARDRLLDQGFEAVLPLGARQLPGGALRIAPLFGPYLIVRFDVSRPGWRRIASTRGMRRLFGSSPERPTSLREDDAEAIRSLSVTTSEVDGPPERGQAVRVVEGPWRGRVGLCIDIAAGVVRALLFIDAGPRDCEVLAKWCRRA